MLMLRCPFLALSATVGNPSEIATWLKGVKATQLRQDRERAAVEGGAVPNPEAYQVHLVQHAERYSDLRPSVYLPTPSPAWQAAADVTPRDARARDSECLVPRVAEALAGATIAFGTAASEASRFRPIHPCTAVSVPLLAELGRFPGTLDLEPRDCLSLYDAMKAAWEEEMSGGASDKVHCLSVCFGRG